MMPMKLVTLSLLFSMLAFGASARAGDRPPGIKGQAPPKPPAQLRAQAVRGPYDISKLDPVDAKTKAAIAALSERCLASEFSREGPSQQEIAKCNAAVASVGAQGKKGASAILAALNDDTSKLRPFARRRLYGVLGKIEDEKTREVLVEGLAKIASDKLSSHASYASEVDRTLRAMAGGGPEVAIPWDGKGTVRDPFVEMAEQAASWRAFQKANAGKSRAQVAQEVLTAARADKKNDDPKKAYRAMVALLQHAPREALGAVKAYRKRSDLATAVADAFESLESQISWQIESPPAARS